MSRPAGVPRPALRGWLTAAAITAFAVCGCAASRQYGQHLLGTPDQGGLLIVDCRLYPIYDSPDFEDRVGKQLQTGVFKMPNQSTMDVVAIQRRDHPDRYFYGTAFADVMVFPNLDPGPYILRSMGHERHVIDHIKGTDYYLAKREFPFAGATGNVITFDIQRGGLSYVGGVDVTARYDLRANDEALGGTVTQLEFVKTDDNWQAVVNYSPARERDAWYKLLRLSEGTAWTDSILDRIEALNSGARFGPPD